MKPIPYGVLGTPWKNGIVAFEAGDPITANPYPDTPLADLDKYPRPFQAWHEGWLHAKHVHQHEERKANG